MKSKVLSYKKGSARADPFRELIRQKFCLEIMGVILAPQHLNLLGFWPAS